jgi:5'-deoxynucleotidase YfbR-like HD superfamily hydrolase
VQVSIHDFQERLQRCVQRCKDKAQELLPASPKEKDIAKAQDKLASCAADCAQEYERQVPKLQAAIVERLKQFK